MGTVTFKNVGQGDSIIVEWSDEGHERIGIIDCNIFNDKNPVLDSLSQKSITEIEFIVLSHFHYDHFSGMPELFKYCIENKIKIKWFLHTFTHSILQIYDKIFKSKETENAAIDFFHYYELLAKNVSNDLAVNFRTTPFNLSDNISMSFLGPSEKIGKDIARQINRKRNIKEFSYSDLNKFSTIIYLQSINNSILFTADSPKGCYKYINEKINDELTLVQAPHHGSFFNIYSDFWEKIQKKKKCPVVFSVGYEPKDKLPNIETVAFFDKLNFDVYSTNSVFGIAEYFSQDKEKNILCRRKTQYLNHFSKKVNTTYRNSTKVSKYEGDQKFIF